MPNNVTAKIVWARKRWLLGAVLGALLFGILVSFVSARHNYRSLRIGQTSYRLKVARTAQSREVGLASRTSMGEHEGMIFVYDRAVRTCFWMKGMYFPLDIIWVDASHKVVYQEEFVSQHSYPKTYCTPVPSQYVIELNAGQAKIQHISVGTKLSF